MKAKFSLSWKSSKLVRKQRKYRANAPLHIKQKFVSVHLAKDLRKKYNTRSFKVRKGDTVKVLTGQFTGKSGKVEKVMLRRSKLNIENIQISKKDGTKAYYPINPSNVMITELNLDDKLRKQKIESFTKKPNQEKKA